MMMMVHRVVVCRFVDSVTSSSSMYEMLCHELGMSGAAYHRKPTELADFELMRAAM